VSTRHIKPTAWCLADVEPLNPREDVVAYALVPLLREDDDAISLTSEQHGQLAQAKRALVATIGIEQKFDLLLENYVEYESELLSLSMRLVAFRHSEWGEFQEQSLGITRRLVNLLSAARMYVDQISHDLSRLFGKEHQVYVAVKKTSAKHYDERFGFRLMETLRNSIQHQSIAGIRLKHRYDTDEPKEEDLLAAADKRQVIVRVIPILNVSDLHDMQLKPSVRAEIEGLGQDDLDLTLLVREYIDGLAAMQYELRRCAQHDRKQWESTIREALTSARDRWSKGAKAVNLIVLDESGKIVQWTHLFPELIDYLNALERKNQGPLRLSRTYVSGRSGNK
jgi:hypothetical protein